MKIAKRLATLFSCFMLFCSSFAVFDVSAKVEVAEKFNVDPTNIVAFDDTYIARKKTLKSTSYLGTNYTTSVSFYNQLNDEQKAVYNAMKTLKPTISSLEIKLLNSISFTSTNRVPTDTEKSGVVIKITNMVQIAIDALLKDNPEIFWLKFGENGCNFDWVWKVTRTGGNYNFVVDSITFYSVLGDSYVSSASSIVSELQSAISSFNINGTDRYHKLKSIHDGLAKRVTYDASATRAYDAYGALIDEYAVCEGYSEAFKLLCDRAGIPCVLVVGKGITSVDLGPHMWNAVQMENGRWYGVDVTWDDQNSIYYDFFLVGSNTKDVNFGGKSFSQTHIISGNFSGKGTKIFTYPTLSAEAYTPSGASATTTTSIVSGRVTNSSSNSATTTTTAPPPVIIPPVISKTTVALVITPSTKATTVYSASNSITKKNDDNDIVLNTQAEQTSSQIENNDTTTTMQVENNTGLQDQNNIETNSTDNVNISQAAVQAKEHSKSPLYVYLLIGGGVLLVIAVGVFIMVSNRNNKS